MTEAEQQSLRFVLDGLVFPAQRWEVITKADWYGADAVTAHRLRQLPVRTHPYRDLRDVLTTLDEIRA
ncbi:MAG TPA: hypothetical protein VHF06_13645 [Pseudonocardiaceae bacterium]|jgi:hypothetical protein|nr:hypothetical protein [Pseudonocardiaceae bacterium]